MPPRADRPPLATPLPTAITSSWNKNIKTLQEKATNLIHLYATYDLIATLTKTILSLYITYLAHTYPLPYSKTEQINNIISTYIAGLNNPTLPVSTLSQTQQNGGYTSYSAIQLYRTTDFLHKNKAPQRQPTLSP